MKKLFILNIIALASIFTLAILQPVKAVVINPEPYTCPAGTYPLGNGECKNEPTGCPYAESAPLGPECDKLAPKAQETPVTTQPAPAPASQPTLCK